MPLKLTAYALAKAIGVPRTRIERIVEEKVGITADTALRLSRYFGNSAEFWLNLQSRFDVLNAERALAKGLEKIEPRQTEAA
jgi:addiction module HigA family antidote